ncbi:MAG: S-layer homology domain-containing protein [Chloroflexota bacterium]|nr:S-layer homology domain-containing protein [Chloroflexota bacterium]
MKTSETRRALWSVTAMLAIMLGVGLFVGSAFASLPTNHAQSKSSNAPGGNFTETPTITATLTLTLTATGTATEELTATTTTTATITATSTATEVLTSTATGTSTATAVLSATTTATGTITATQTVTATGTVTGTVTGTSSATAVASMTGTATRTSTSVASTTATRTVTGTVTATRTPGNGRVAICHRTGSERNPWVQIEISENALPAHQAHGDIYPVPAEGCPGPGTPAPTTSVTPQATETAEACDMEFEDVPPGHTFHAFVRCLACKQILGGYSDGTYRYGNPVTRGQISKIVANAAGYLEEVSGQTFSDVPPGSTFYEFIERMAARGHISGYENGTFRPSAPATRGQIAKIVSNAAGFRDPVSGQTYTDVPPQQTFYLYIERLSKRGIVSGYSDGTFRSNALTTRGQAAKMVANAFFPICPNSED